MSTDIKESFVTKNGHASLYQWDNDRIDIGLTIKNDEGEIGAVAVERADFLAAVETECNVIIIDKSELPEVVVQPGISEVRTGAYRWHPAEVTPESLRDEARASLAMAEYLDAHPPVDPAQVDALVTLILNSDNNELTGTQIDNLARKLLESGKVEVKNV